MSNNTPELDRFSVVKAPRPDGMCECCDPQLARWVADGWTVRAGKPLPRRCVEVRTPTATLIRSSSRGMRALAAALIAAADHAEGKTR